MKTVQVLVEKDYSESYAEKEAVIPEIHSIRKEPFAVF